MPTLAELAGIPGEVPKDIDGISIVPTLLGMGEQEEHEYLFWQAGARAVRMGKWKAIGQKDRVALYDLDKDIGEKHDIAEQHPDIASKMQKFMTEAWVNPRSQKDDGKYTGREPKKRAR